MRAERKEFFAYVVPSVLAFALSGVYTIVDGFFVGQSLGDPGLAAITLGYPLSALVGAVGTGIGLSGAIRYTILNAQGETEKGEECFSAAALLLTLAALLLTALLYGFAEPILRLLGAEGDVLAQAVEYARVIALGAVFQVLATGFVPFIRNMGGASFAMAAMILGFVSNVILDYAFVWVVGWGMAGAALATILGQAATMAAAIGFFLVKRHRLRLPAWRELRRLWGGILKVSLSPFGLTFSPNITLLLMNRFLLLYGDTQAVAVYGCVGYVTAIIYLLLQGVGDGSQPLVSRYYGEGKAAGTAAMERLAYLTAAGVTMVCMLGVFLTRRQIGVLFGASADASADVARYLPYFLAPLLFLAFVRVTTSCFFATEETLLSYILVYAEPVCTLLLLLVLPPLLPPALRLTSVWLAVPLAQTAAFGVGLFEKRLVRVRRKVS